MARYQKDFPVVSSPAETYEKIKKLLTSKGYKYREEEWAFRKGDGFWLAAQNISIRYSGQTVRLEAWVDGFGSEMDLEGFVGVAAKKPLRKMVTQVEAILAQADSNYTAAPETGEQTASVQVETLTPAEEERLPADVDKATYFKKYADGAFKRAVKGAAILGYVCVGINTVVSLLANPIGLIESGILLALTLGMHLRKSKACAIGLLVLAIIEMVAALVLNGSIGPWLWLITGIWGVTAFKNAEKRYQELKNKQ